MIQDGKGQRMSKSAGNGIDPVDIIDLYGADALRFTLACSATETQDLRMPVEKAKLPDGRDVNTSERFEQGRTFPNKFWNAARFALMNLEGYEPAPVDRLPTCRSRIAGSSACSATTTASDDCRPRGLPVRRGDPSGSATSPGTTSATGTSSSSRAGSATPTRPPVAQRVLAAVLDGLCRLLHPIMPFLTEQVWQALGQVAPAAACPSPRPPPRASASPPGRLPLRPGSDARPSRSSASWQEKIQRDPQPPGRAERPQGSQDRADHRRRGPGRDRLRRARPFIESLTNAALADHRSLGRAARESAVAVLADAEIILPLRRPDRQGGRGRRLRKALADIERQLAASRAKLETSRSSSSAPAEVVEQQRAKEAELLAQQSRRSPQS